MTSLEGAVLVGGGSRRMGRDKRTLELGGRPMLERIVENVSSVVSSVRLVGGASSAVGGDAAPARQEDLRPGLGPLSGIHAALATTRYDAVLVVACDLPFVTSRFLRGLLERLSDEFDAVVPWGRAGPVPVCAVYRTRCLAVLEQRLEREELSARGFASALSVRYVRGEELASLDPEDRCLMNLNTPADYERARASFEAEDAGKNAKAP